MSTTALSPSSPISSGEIQTIDLERLEEVARRHQLLQEYLQLKGFDGLLLKDPANFAWLTCGGDNTFHGSSDPVAAILLTGDARVVLCNNIDSGQIFDRELMGLGFLLKERPWTETPEILRLDVCRGRKIGSDSPCPGSTLIGEDLCAFRLQYSHREEELLRELGRDVAHAVEATARNFDPGSTEADVAAHLAHRLIRHHVQPVRMQVLADGQGWRYRHWSYGGDRIERHCVISATGRRGGLHVTASRTVCIGSPPDELQRSHHLATVVQATGMYFSQHGWPVSETWQRVGRIYEKFEIPDEWRSAEQGEVIGYKPCERAISPKAEWKFSQQTAVCWHPSVRAAFVADTIFLREQGFELLTPAQNWPVLTVSLKGQAFARPGILIREVTP